MCRRWHFLRGLVLDQEMATSSMYHRPEAVDEHGLGDLLRGDGVLLRLVDRAGQTPEQLLARARLLPVAHQQPRPVHARPLEVQRLHRLLRLALKKRNQTAWHCSDEALPSDVSAPDGTSAWGRIRNPALG